MTLRSTLAILPVFALGYLFGLQHDVASVSAQDATLDAPLGEDAANEVRTVNRSLDSAKEELESEGRYVAATKGVNPFLVLAGGGDAVADLESDDGVDPETFAALYAGRVAEELKDDVALDDEGRVLYKGRVVRMYSIKRLKQLYDRREELAADQDF